MDRRSWLRAVAALVGIAAVTLAAVAVDFSDTGRYTLSLWQPVTWRPGLGLGGGTRVLLRAQATNGRWPDSRALERDRTIIAERLNAATDIAEPSIAALGSGKDRYISVEAAIAKADVPAIQDLLQKTGALTMIAIAGPPPAHPFVRKCYEKPHPPGVRDLTGDSARGYRVLLQGRSVIPSSLSVGTDTLKGSPVVDAALSAPAAARLRSYLAHSPAPFMGIAIDDKIYDVRPSAHVFLGLGDQFQITNTTGSICVTSLTTTTINLIAVLKYGTLPAPLQIVAVQSIGPVVQPTSAGALGLIILAALVIAILTLGATYRIFGVLAVTALAVDEAVVVAIVKLVAFPLTLAGLAGLALSLIVAVSVQAGLSHRVRSGRDAGRPVVVAIAEGITASWPTVRDSAALGALLCAVLWWMGTIYAGGSLVDFAAVLFIGLGVATATALVVSPTLLWLYAGIHELTHGSRGGEPVANADGKVSAAGPAPRSVDFG